MFISFEYQFYEYDIRMQIKGSFVILEMACRFMKFIFKDKTIVVVRCILVQFPAEVETREENNIASFSVQPAGIPYIVMRYMR